MSTQRRTFFALRGANPDHVQMPSIPNFSLCGGNVFTINCVFYTAHKEAEDIFIKQGDVFSAGMTNGAVYFEAKHLGRIVTTAKQSPIEEDDWTCFTVVYDGSKLSLYVQGFLAVEKTVGAGTRHVDDKTRYQLALMEGYLQDVAIYSKALSADEVRKNLFTPQVGAQNTELLASFDAFLPSDEGKHKLPMQLIGACETVNLVESMICDKDASALPIGASPVNPGSRELGSYTILAKAYPQYKVITGDVYLFANGKLGQVDTIALGLSDGQKKPFFVVGTQRFDFDGAIEPNLWVDIAVTVAGQTVTLYLDGAAKGTSTLSTPFVRQSQGALTFGNIMSGNKFANGFTGFLDSIAVFSVALPANRILGYADIAPYAFDTDLAALWAFYDREASELLGGGTVSVTGGARVALCRNTVLDRIVPKLEFAIPDTQTGLSDLQGWETDTSTKAINLCIKEITGMEPEGCFNEQGKLCGSLRSTLFSANKDNETMGKIQTSETATAEDMRDIMNCVIGAVAFGIIIYAFYQMCAYRGTQRTRLLMRIMRWAHSHMPTITFVPILVGSAAMMTQYIQTSPPPDTEKAETDEFDISLVSLSFYNNESEQAGALCARPSFTQPPVVPEWVHTVTPSAPVLYHRNIPTGKTPTLRAVFSVTLKKGGSVAITLGAKAHSTDSLMLGDIAEKTITVTASGNQTVDFPLDKNILRQSALGKRQISWGWYYKSAAQHVLKTTLHQIHVIHDKPLSPWTTAKDSSCLPVYSLLSHCADIAARTETETEENKRFANQLVDWTNSASRFTACGLKDSAHYARWDRYHRKLTADLEGFTTELGKTAAVSVTFLDIACLQLLLTRLEGLPELHLYEMQSMFGDFLHTRTAKGLGGVALPSDAVRAYYTCGIKGASQSAAVWDAFATLKAPDDQDFTVKGTPFEKFPYTMDLIGPPDKTLYYTLLCGEGTSCAIVMSTQQLFVGTLPVQGIAPARDKHHLRTSPDRKPFVARIAMQFVLPTTLVRCHSISYAYMQRCIVEMVNKVIDKSVTSDTCKEVLSVLTHAVTGYPEMPGVLDVAGIEARRAWVALLGTTYIPGLAGAIDVCDDIDNLVDTATNFLVALNNIAANLRLGQSDWNVRIQESYDCLAWMYVYKRNDDKFHFGSSHAAPTLDTLAELPDYPSFLQEGFYLLNMDRDNKKLILLDELQQEPCSLDLHFVTGYFTQEYNEDNCDTDKRRQLIYSSSNKWQCSDYSIVTRSDQEVEPNIFICIASEWVQIK